MNSLRSPPTSRRASGFGAQAMQLAGVFDLDGMDELLNKERGVAEQHKLSYYCQITVSDADSGREHARIMVLLSEVHKPRRSHALRPRHAPCAFRGVGASGA